MKRVSRGPQLKQCRPRCQAGTLPPLDLGTAVRRLVAVIVVRAMSGGYAATIRRDVDKGKGKLTAGGPTTLISSPGAALQASAVLSEDLEEERRCPVVLEVDGVTSLWAAGAGNRTPSSSYENITRVNDLDFRF